MDSKQTLIYVMAAVAVLIISMVAYLLAARKNDSNLKLRACSFLFFGLFSVYATHRFLSPDEGPRYFEANLSIEADGQGVCALPVAGLYPRELLIRARSAIGANSNQPVEIELELKSEKGGEVALASKDRLLPDSGGQWEQIKKEFAPKVEGDHILTVKTSLKVGTVQVKVEY